MQATFTHPTYTITHICGHSVTKQVLEATENKRRRAVKAMSEMKCIECINKTAPVISEDIWGDTEVVKSYWTVQYYQPSGLGNAATFTNIYAASQEDAIEIAASSNRIEFYNRYRLYAFKQASREF